MKRFALLAVILTAGALSVAVSAVQQQPAAGQKPRVVEVEKLKDNLFMLKGGGGNTAVFVTTKGVVVVDTKNPGWGAPLIAKIRELTDKPITTIINTHSHGDHVSGNVEFEPNVDVVVQANTAANMKKMASPPGLGPATPPAQTIFQQNDGRGLPKRTFKDKMTIGSGADQIELRYFGRGHTNGDAWIVFPALRTMHAGDIFSGKNIPILDSNNGGSGVDMPKTLKKAADFAKNVDAIITGHSTVMTVADLREYSEFNRDFLNAVREGKKAGKTADEIAAAWKNPAKYAGYAEPQPARLKVNVEVVLAEIK
jgi:glyoxylase-like metal-dependent hydrolase (beta-lactamase superfamily II)